MEHLQQECEKHLVDSLSPITVAELLLLADHHGCELLKAGALDYCMENHAYIMKVIHFRKYLDISFK